MPTQLISVFLFWPILFFSAVNHANATTANIHDRAVKETEAQLRKRLSTLDICLNVQYHPAILRQVNRYTTTGKRATEYLLGKKELYFPIFEHFLRKHGVPEELKYLSVWESRLNPTAISKAKAGGFWQFIPATAKKYNLRISDEVDERFDPYKSTEAAVLYLKELHAALNDWTLAIAAYNCGLRRVKKAIKQGGSRNFWEIRAYLPLQTCNYVPAIIATIHTFEHYHYYNLRPRYKGFAMYHLRTTKVYSALSFRRLAKLTGLSIGTIKKLNPSYLKRHFLPSKEGSYLILPEYVIPRVRHILHTAQRLPTRTAIDLRRAEQSGYQIVCVIKAGDTAAYLSKLYNCEIEDLKRWNKRKSGAPVVGEEWLIFVQIERQVSPPLRG